MTEEQKYPADFASPRRVTGSTSLSAAQTVRLFHRRRVRQHFLDLVEPHSEERDVRVTAYTFMSNHFHLVAVGDCQDAISNFMMEVN